jgi:telomerase protein component 1
MCEECDFQIFSSPGPSHQQPNLRVELKDGTILHNMKAVLEAVEQLGYECQFPFGYLEDLIRTRRKVDQIIVLSNTHIAPGYDEKEGIDPLSAGGISRILKKYRQEVNPDLLYVAVNLSSPKGITTPKGDEEQHQNDVTISGFSDAILK